MEDETDTLVFEKIFSHLTQISFGKDVYSDGAICAALKKSLPMMKSALHLRQKGDVSIDIALEVASQLMNERINRLKKDDEKRLCFEAAFIMLFGLQHENLSIVMTDTNQLLAKYPEFRNMDAVELNVLLSYRNVMVVAQQIIPAKNHKNHLLELVTRIAEGRNAKYITGSGQTDATSRRVLVYRREGDVSPIRKPSKASEEGEGKAGPKRAKHLDYVDRQKQQLAPLIQTSTPLVSYASSPLPLSTEVITLADLHNFPSASASASAPAASTSTSFLGLGPSGALPLTASIGVKRQHSLDGGVSLEDIKADKSLGLGKAQRQFSWASQFSTADQCEFLTPFLQLMTSGAIEVAAAAAARQDSHGSLHGEALTLLDTIAVDLDSMSGAAGLCSLRGLSDFRGTSDFRGVSDIIDFSEMRGTSDGLPSSL